MSRVSTRYLTTASLYLVFSSVGITRISGSDFDEDTLHLTQEQAKDIDAAANQLPRGHDAGNLRLGDYITALQEHVFQQKAQKKSYTGIFPETEFPKCLKSQEKVSKREKTKTEQ
eukprot:4570442-Amphidinium_carterae.1